MESGDEVAAVLDTARGLARERRWGDLARLYDAAPPDARPRDAELDYLFADALRRVGRNDEAAALAREAERAATRAADRRLSLRATNLLGMIAFDTGALASAGRSFDLLLDRASVWGDDEFVARAANNLGVLANVRAERELAMTYYQRAMAAYHRLGHMRGLAQTSYNLGISFRDLGFAEEAERHYVEAIRYAELSESEDVVALAETERAFLRAVDGDGELAESLASRALERHRRMEDPGGAANALRVLARAAEATGDSGAALERLDEALDLTRRHRDPLLGAEVQRDRGRILHALGDRDAARAALIESAETFGRLGVPTEAATSAALLASLFPPDQPDPSADR